MHVPKRPSSNRHRSEVRGEMRGAQSLGAAANAPSLHLVCLVLMHPTRNGIRVDSIVDSGPSQSGLKSGLKSGLFYILGSIDDGLPARTEAKNMTRSRPKGAKGQNGSPSETKKKKEPYGRTVPRGAGSSSGPLFKRRTSRRRYLP
jgi:hypothetical protein